MLARLIFGSAAAVVAFATVQSSSAAGLRYRATILRSTYAATGAYAQAMAINDNGIAAGTDAEQYDALNARATTWNTNGAPSTLPLPTGAPQSLANDINNAGVVAGSYILNGTVYGNTWAADGARTDLALGSRGLAINNAGQVLLIRNSGQGSGALYSNGTTTTIAGGIAYGLSDTGVVVGISSIVTPPMARRFLLAPAQNFGTTTGTFNAVNDSGQMAGRYGRAMVSVAADGTVTNLGSAPSNYTFYENDFSPRSINDRGVVVGWAAIDPVTTPSIEARLRATLFQNGQMVDLSTLIDGDAGTWILRRANDVNNRGQIVGYGVYDADGAGPLNPTREAFRLDPIRTPGDTNYDNLVNFADLLTLAQNYSRSGNGEVFYETGDFNYDWKVDFADLVTLAQNYRVSAADGTLLSSSSFASDWALAQSLVPEAASAGVVLLLGMLARRRR